MLKTSKLLTWLFLGGTWLSFSPSLMAQGLVINEVLPSNSHNLRDENGDYPDWIEFFNASAQVIDLEGYSLTDDRNQPLKYVFPTCQVDPSAHLLVYASGDQGTDVVRFWNTVVRQGDTWSYLIPSQEPPSAWREPGFDDNSWLSGATGIGYGDGDDSTVISPALSVYMRKRFQASYAADIGDILLQIDYDDAFVAYLNGTEIARSGIGVPGSAPSFDTPASANHEAMMYGGGQPESFHIAVNSGVLHDGENILALQVYNTSLSSSDMSAIPYLSLRTSAAPGSPPPTELNLPATGIYTGFKIDADGDTVYLFSPTGNIVDSAVIVPVRTDYSLGRQPDGTGAWVVFTEPTPGGPNDTPGYGAGENDVPVFSLAPGFYPGPVRLELSPAHEGDTICYTTDGSEPGPSSAVYASPLDLSVPMVVRARVLKAGMLPGRILTNTYIIGRRPDLPVVSVTTDPANLWDENYGIYILGPNASVEAPYFGANFWQDWERPAHVEMFETDGTNAFSIDAGIRIYGNYSRANPQKSMAVYARKMYGDKQVDYPIFKDKPAQKYESFIIRNAGNDWYGGGSGSGSMFRDLLSSRLARNLDIDVLAGRQAVVFLNGEYWGIQNMREKINEHYVANNHNVDPDNVNLLEGNGWVIQGSNSGYNELIDYLHTHDPSTDAAYQWVSSRIDIPEYMNYLSTEIYIFNGDWPGNNIKFWQAPGEQDKWRWIMFDTDFGFGIWDANKVYHNTLSFALDEKGEDWPNPPWSTFLFRSLMKNETFRNEFITHFNHLLNTTFEPRECHSRDQSYPQHDLDGNDLSCPEMGRSAGTVVAGDQ